MITVLTKQSAATGYTVKVETGFDSQGDSLNLQVRFIIFQDKKSVEIDSLSPALKTLVLQDYKAMEQAFLGAGFERGPSESMIFTMIDGELVKSKQGFIHHQHDTAEGLEAAGLKALEGIGYTAQLPKIEPRNPAHTGNLTPPGDKKPLDIAGLQKTIHGLVTAAHGQSPQSTQLIIAIMDAVKAELGIGANKTS